MVLIFQSMGINTTLQKDLNEESKRRKKKRKRKNSHKTKEKLRLKLDKTPKEVSERKGENFFITAKARI